MRILFLSKSGDSAGLWNLCKQEGAQVSAFIEDRVSKRVMEGIIDKKATVEEAMRWNPDVTVIDMTGFKGLADTLRKDGHKVVGGGALADKIEFDRAYGVSLCKQYGIKVPKTTEFKNVDEAMDFIRKTNKAYAIKMDSNAGGESASYVAKDAKDMLDYLEQQKESGKIDGNTFVVQEKVDGAEISTELWLSGGSPCYPANSTWETKKLLAGELGPRTGAETSLVAHYEGSESKVLDQTIRKILPLLKYSKWTGPIDVNCIVNKEGCWFLEWTPRLGYSAIYAYTAILGMPVSEYFYRMAREPFTIPFKAKWGTSLKLHIPPYPFGFEDDRIVEKVYGETEGIRIKGDEKDFIPIDVKRGTKTQFETAGTMGIVGECVGRGNSAMEAWKGSKKVFEAMEAPNKGGRFTDGIDDAWKRILKLRQFGFAEIPAPTSGQQISSGVKAGKPLTTVAPEE